MLEKINEQWLKGHVQRFFSHLLVIVLFIIGFNYKMEVVLELKISISMGGSNPTFYVLQFSMLSTWPFNTFVSGVIRFVSG